MTAADPDRNLPFGLLAIQNGLKDRVQLVSAFQAWARSKRGAIADHLVERGNLGALQRRLLEGLVAQHRKNHGRSAEKSLAAIAIGPPACESLSRAAGAVLERACELMRARTA
jgi:hypothetical protein